MERKQLIECITNGVVVKYQDTEYLPVGYTLRRKDGKWWHQAILQDMVSGRCEVYAALDKVEA